MAMMVESPLKDPRLKTWMDAKESEHKENGAVPFDMAALPLFYDACFFRAGWNNGDDG